MITKFKKLLYSKLTLGLVLSVLGSLIFAVILKFSLAYYFDINPVRGGLTVIDLTCFLSIVTWKILLSTFIELILGEKFYNPIGVYINDINSTISKMDKGKDTGAYKGESSSKSSKTNDTSCKSAPLDTIDYHDLFMETTANLDRQYEMVKKLRDLKSSKDLKYYINKGALELEVPSNLSETEANTLSNKVGIMDRIYNTKYSEYKSLLKKDSRLEPSVAGLRQHVKDGYTQLFDK